MALAVFAARTASHDGDSTNWPSLSHAARASFFLDHGEGTRHYLETRRSGATAKTKLTSWGAAQTIPSDVASIRKGILPKDVIEKRKQVEKLSPAPAKGTEPLRSAFSS